MNKYLLGRLVNFDGNRERTVMRGRNIKLTRENRKLEEEIEEVYEEVRYLLLKISVFIIFNIVTFEAF